MSETSRSRVTITLGRTGQVVKKEGTDLQSSLTDMRPVAGSKRSIHERLGSYVDYSDQVNYKRLRGDYRSGAGSNGIHLSENDLRYKIIHKNRLKQSNNHQNGVDLRNILSRPAQPSSNSIDSWDMIPEQRDTRRRHMELTNSRQQFMEMSDGRHLQPNNRHSSQHMPYSQLEHSYDPRKPQVYESREGGRDFLEMKEDMYKRPEPTRPSLVSSTPGLRTSSGYSRMEPKSSSYSPWTLDQLRKRSPERFAASSSIMALKRDDASHNRCALGTYNTRNQSKSEEAFELSKPTPRSSSHFTEVTPSVGQMRSKAPVSSVPPRVNITNKSSSAVEDPVTIDSFLRSLDLERFAVLFKVEEVDMYSLKRMVEGDLAEMGIPMGPRKKILLALQSHKTQQAR